jgi:hypothetical protein
MSKKAKGKVGLRDLKPALEQVKEQAHVSEPITVIPLGQYEVNHFLDEFSKESGASEAMRVYKIREDGYAKMSASDKIMKDPIVTLYQQHLRDRRALEVKINTIVTAHEREIKETRAWTIQVKFLKEVKHFTDQQIDQLFKKLITNNLYIWVADELQELADCKYAIGLEEAEALSMIHQADAISAEGRAMLTEANALAPTVLLPVHSRA